MSNSRVGRSWSSAAAVRRGPVSITADSDVGRVYYKSYDGEKNIGAVGPAIDYTLDYEMLRIRSWQMWLESDIALTVLKKYTLWIIDCGLKLKANPSQLVLKSEGINFNNKKESYNEVAEARWQVWAKSFLSSHSGMMTLVDTAKEAYTNVKIGGDVLVVMRYDKRVTVQLIDGAHLCSPFVAGSANGNKVVRGVELDSSGNHVAYHVRTRDGKSERIVAVSPSSGFRVAFLVYGGKHRLDSHRGVPAMAASIETLKMIDRYKAAAVGSAEERQKIPYFVSHESGMIGENPIAANLRRALDVNVGGIQGSLPVDDAGDQMANNIAVTTKKQVFNMPVGSKLESLESKQEMFFKDFYYTNADMFCASLNIPPNVAYSLYTNSYSASRAATKDWDHTMVVERDYFSSQFYQRIYDFWQYTQVLENKIFLPGYIEAVRSGNFMILGAYQVSSFTGPMFPHIDPLKEVMAERAKLGPAGANFPLSTQESSTDALNSGDSDSNSTQFSQELKTNMELGISRDPLLGPAMAEPSVLEEPKDPNPDD